MKYNELQLTKSPSRKRVGRGIAAGQGKTAGRGTKGQGSRTGKKLSHTFSGGQLPLVKSTPKAKGFKSQRVPAQVVYLDTLNSFEGKVADNQSLFDAHYVASPYHNIKVITRGEIKKAITLRVQGASKSAQAAIANAGGSFEAVSTPLKPSSKKAEKEA